MISLFDSTVTFGTNCGAVTLFYNTHTSKAVLCVEKLGAFLQNREIHLALFDQESVDKKLVNQSGLYLIQVGSEESDPIKKYQLVRSYLPQFENSQTYHMSEKNLEQLFVNLKNTQTIEPHSLTFMLNELRKFYPHVSVENSCPNSSCLIS